MGVADYFHFHATHVEILIGYLLYFTSNGQKAQMPEVFSVLVALQACFLTDCGHFQHQPACDNCQHFCQIWRRQIHFSGQLYVYKNIKFDLADGS